MVEHGLLRPQVLLAMDGERAARGALKTPARSSPACPAARRGSGPSSSLRRASCLEATSFSRAPAPRGPCRSAPGCGSGDRWSSGSRAEVAASSPSSIATKLARRCQRVGDLGLVAAGVFVEQQQHRELRRRQLQRRDAAQEIVEHLQLRALGANSPVVRTIRPYCRAAASAVASAGCLAGGTGGFWRHRRRRSWRLPSLDARKLGCCRPW